MGRLILHEHPDPDRLELERALRYARLPWERQWKELMSLIRTAVMLNDGQPLKKPQGKGIVLRKIR